MIAPVFHSPGQIAQQLTGREYLSWSAVSTFLRCPLRYRFRYIDNLPEPFVSANLVFGSAIHAALEAHYRELLVAEHPPDLLSLLAVYHEYWKQVDLATVHFGCKEDLATLGALAERMLIVFLASKLSRPAGHILGIEEEFTAPVISGCPHLFARLDLLVEHEESLLVTDFKTSRSRWSRDDVDAAAGQLLVYHELVHQLTDKPVQLQFALFTKTKSPEITLYPVTVEPGHIERIKRLIAGVWRAITSGHFYPSPSALNCSGCPYRAPCAAWRG